MHPRNPYRISPDFSALAEAYEPLQEYLISDTLSRRRTIDFKNDGAQRRLTEAILFCDFGIVLRIPDNRLCPPVPNRLNYILWIQDIMHAHDHVSSYSERRVRGIDIGTGSTAIYPFLACALDSNWEFIATELDEESYHCAQTNIVANGMESRILLRKVSREDPILSPLQEAIDTKYDFVICNPPFYGSAKEIAQSASDKELPPNAVCTGADVEMIFNDGGEAGFVSQMVIESERLHNRCEWYTSMLGKMSSVATIVELLRNLSITNYMVTEFVQGQTRRWAVGWTFSYARLPDPLTRIPSMKPVHPLYQYMPSRNTITQMHKDYSDDILFAVLSEHLNLLEGLSIRERHMRTDRTTSQGPPPSAFSTRVFVIEGDTNTWSREYRRARRQVTLQAEQRGESDFCSFLPPSTYVIPREKIRLRCSIRVIMVDEVMTAPSTVSALEFQWLYGIDREMFYSFANHVDRKVATTLKTRIDRGDH
ncbi:hypothetical protein B0H34DRAFT_200530 [Crassisporium funariophilum]|nr:hypothetical protein B0H34DRAFT_200530 [Crassisporium funariophilum]